MTTRADARSLSAVSSATILDVDGTLVDTNYHHAIAWDRAFARHDTYVPLWRIHRRSEELLDAGAVAVYESVVELHDDLDSALSR